MDPITHMTSGLLTAQAFRPSTGNRLFFILCIIGSLIPDIDNFAGLWGPEFYLIHHRGVTHSIFGAIALAALLGFFYTALNGFYSKKKSFAILLFLVFIHIFLDMITSYGTQIFYPFTRHRYEIASVFIIDPFFTISLIGIALLSYKFKENRVRIAVFGLIWLVIYPAIGYGVRSHVQYRVEHHLIQNGNSQRRVHVLPEAFSPVYWKVILEDEKNYYLGVVCLMENSKKIEYERYEKADLVLMRTLGEKVSFFKTFAWFASFPFMEIDNSGDQEIITFGDLRFISMMKLLKNRSQRNGRPFSISAVLDINRNIIGYTYRKPGGTQIIQHIE
ncbi:MAG: metal-dependent hydrolase [Thermodesulfobacteriota bacterium]